MPYDEALAERVRDLLAGENGLVEKKMFGGVGWTLHGNMACGAHSDGRLMVRAAPDDWAEWLEEPGVGGIERGGKPMRGWLLVDAAVVEDDAALRSWVGRGRDYARSLPAK
ncbi:MAG: TfoX family protein [Deltaproteobacteria bacterium]|nr:MAG: TfoX family protein [Deltaproteobacteria bacterium]